MNKGEITPFYPLPYRKSVGNTVVNEYSEPFEDLMGNKATIHYVDYTDKKGKLIEKFIMRVEWL